PAPPPLSASLPTDSQVTFNKDARTRFQPTFPTATGTPPTPDGSIKITFVPRPPHGCANDHPFAAGARREPGGSSRESSQAIPPPSELSAACPRRHAGPPSPPGRAQDVAAAEGRGRPLSRGR